MIAMNNKPALPPAGGPIYQVETFRDTHGRVVEKHTRVFDAPGSAHPVGDARFIGKVTITLKVGPRPDQIIQHEVGFLIPVSAAGAEPFAIPNSVGVAEAFAQFNQFASAAAEQAARDVKQKLMGGPGLILPGG